MTNPSKLGQHEGLHHVTLETNTGSDSFLALLCTDASLHMFTVKEVRGAELGRQLRQTPTLAMRRRCREADFPFGSGSLQGLFLSSLFNSPSFSGSRGSWEPPGRGILLTLGSLNI